MSGDTWASNMPENVAKAMGKAQGCVVGTLNRYVPQSEHKQFRDLQARQLAYVEKMSADHKADRLNLRGFITTLLVNEVRAHGADRERVLRFIRFAANRVLDGEQVGDVVAAFEAQDQPA